MGKSKAGTNIFTIIFKSLIIYIKNFLPLSRVMLFPVFGQIIGMFLIFYPTYLYRQQYLAKLSAENLQQNLVFILLGLLLLVLPGFVIFIKAFWDYMIVTVSLNTMVSDIVKNGNFSNFKIHNNSVKLRTSNYVILLLILTLFWLGVLFFPFLSCFFGIFINPEFILPVFSIMMMISAIFTIVLCVNHSLVFQIFAFETASPIGTIKKSWHLIKENFWRTFFMGILLILSTWWLIPNIITSLFEKSPFMSYSVQPFEAYVNLFTNNQGFIEFLAKANLSPHNFSIALDLMTVATIVASLLLPLGSVCFTLLYFDISERKKPAKRS
jgi:hypothetical protein